MSYFASAHKVFWQETDDPEEPLRLIARIPKRRMRSWELAGMIADYLNEQDRHGLLAEDDVELIERQGRKKRDDDAEYER